MLLVLFTLFVLPKVLPETLRAVAELDVLFIALAPDARRFEVASSGFGGEKTFGILD